MALTQMITPLEEIAMAKGEAKGTATARQQDILDALEVRFGTVPEDLRKQVEQIADESRLRRALRLAISEPSLDRFLANL